MLKSFLWRDLVAGCYLFFPPCFRIYIQLIRYYISKSNSLYKIFHMDFMMIRDNITHIKNKRCIV